MEGVMELIQLPRLFNIGQRGEEAPSSGSIRSVASDYQQGSSHPICAAS